MLCAFCFYGFPFVGKPAAFIIDGISTCEEHVDNVTGQGFRKDLEKADT
jgi:hypothetical protein